MSDDLAADTGLEETIIWWWVGTWDVKDELDLEDTSQDDVDIEKALVWRMKEEQATTEAVATSDVSRDGAMVRWY